ncbi:MAG: hypothetical protein FJ096_05610 [Deltaproteobacteria bacterium]|nr:hypothetical protein [Deltaproteobacteria bacterium]
MDQDNFDQQLIAYLFDELDEHGRSEVRRHLEGSLEARELETRLRATVELTQLPVEQPSEDLEERILAAVARAERGEPWHRKLVRYLAWAGSHAMRPQFAMGSLMVMLLGSSLLLLRAKPGAMRVSAEAGGATESMAVRSAGRGPAAATSVAGGGPPLAAASPVLGTSAQAANGGGATGRPNAEQAGGPTRTGGGPESDLEGARSVRASSGCKQAIPMFAALRERFGSSGFGADATFEEAECYRELDNRQRARELAATLGDHPEYRRRLAELVRDKPRGSTGGAAAAAPAPKAATKASASKSTSSSK